MSRKFTVTIEVEIEDAVLVRNKAEEHAQREEMTLADWRKIRSGSDDDLVMIFDPGSFPGCKIIETTAEEH